MYGVWLAGVLAALTVQARSTEPICVGMTTKEVNEAAGEVVPFVVGPDSVCIGAFTHTDYIGGVKCWRMHKSIPDDCVISCRADYYPFAATPPWLDALRDAIFGSEYAPLLCPLSRPIDS